MALLSFTKFCSLPRCHSSCHYLTTNIVKLQDLRLQHRWVIKAVYRKKVEGTFEQDGSDKEVVVVERKTCRSSKRIPSRSRKNTTSETPEDACVPVVSDDVTDEETTPSVSSEHSKTTRRRTQKKATSSFVNIEEGTEKRVTRRRTKKKVDDIEDQSSETKYSDREEDLFNVNMDVNEEDLDLEKDGCEDISFTYGWPPLVCCFGAAQHAFVPWGRPANRLVDYEMHERQKNALWVPEKFIRAPGGCSSSVAVALARLGGKVAFMGKVGDDDYGQSLVYYLNSNNVQTRSVCIDGKKVTAISQMKMGKRGGLKMICAKPCAEDSLSRSQINIDVLKEAKMFYFNSFPLLDRGMRSTTMQAIKISKRLGGVIFYDLNLPLPLWHTGEETKMFIQQAWNHADIIEVTKQELEFLCGIKTSERFDTKDNDRSKFVHYKPDVIAPLWHENLKILFVTNGTSKVHYYTKELNGSILGMEDPPITPFTCEMSASGDGIVAGIMRKFTVQPHLITDKGYLEHTIKYAINCGVKDQWLMARILGHPPKEGMEDVDPDLNGIRSITEREYRTQVPAGSLGQ